MCGRKNDTKDIPCLSIGFGPYVKKDEIPVRHGICYSAVPPMARERYRQMCIERMNID